MRINSTRTEAPDRELPGATGRTRVAPCRNPSAGRGEARSSREWLKTGTADFIDSGVGTKIDHFAMYANGGDGCRLVGIVEVKRYTFRPTSIVYAWMELPVICVFTHDSIGVGEDGPMHQPIEQLAHMRSMPGLVLWPVGCHRGPGGVEGDPATALRASSASSQPAEPAPGRPEKIRSSVRSRSRRLLLADAPGVAARTSFWSGRAARFRLGWMPANN